MFYELYYIDCNGVQTFVGNCDYLKYEELLFRYNNKNGVYVYRFGKYILVFCTTNYGSVWLNQTS